MRKNEKKEMFCSLDYFMKNKCRNCKLERLCNEWDNNRTKRNSNSNDDNSSINSNKSQQ